MKRLVVQTEIGEEQYAVGDSADVQILDNGSLWCDDYQGTIIVYAEGRFTSAIIAPEVEEDQDGEQFDCKGTCQRHCADCATRTAKIQQELDEDERVEED